MKIKLKAFCYSGRSRYAWWLVDSHSNIVAESPEIYETSKKAIAAGRKFIKDIKTAEIVEE